MAYTVADILNELSAHGFEDIDQAQLLYFINDTYYEICAMAPYPFLEATYSGAFTINNGTLTITDASGHTVDTILAIVNTTQGYPLIPERLDNITKQYAGTLTNASTPIYYYMIGETRYVYPIPSAADSYIVRYTVLPVELGATDTPIIPLAHRRLITLGALYKAYMMNDDTDIAQAYKAEYLGKIKAIQENLWRRNFDRTEVVADTREDYNSWDNDY